MNPDTHTIVSTMNQTIATQSSGTPAVAAARAQQTEDPIEALARTVYTSTALNNDFYDKWTRGRCAPKQIAVFARNYGEVVRAFPEILSVMISNTRNVEARTEYAKTLYSEMGYGRVDKVHSVLLDAWFEQLGNKLGEPETLVWENMAANVAVLPETTGFIEGQRRLYSADNATGSGAQLAQEWQAYTMLRKLYDGATQYKGLWELEDEFHEACEYFYAHIGAAEKEHKLESLAGAQQFHVDGESKLRIESGFHEHLRLYGNFWTAVARAMNSME
ncbi:iron-containing redox enzyme family protein [Pendulispora albinea]|uniref:Iron-containing redox enzyme family protein n=1 Tax=Pendulispora albinea TaxID=2741071 RepID=A0ABZ2LSN5_9BACT